MGKESFLVVADTMVLVSDQINTFCVTNVQTIGENIQQLKAGLLNLFSNLDKPNAAVWLWRHWGDYGCAAAKLKC